MLKIGTNKEQSEKLSKILPEETADMTLVDFNNYCLPICKPYKEYYIIDHFGFEKHPAWSLSALLSQLKYGSKLSKSEYNNSWHCINGFWNNTNWFDDPVDAVVEEILKQNK